MLVTETDDEPLTHCRALVSVSSVVNVFDDTTNSVSAGSRSWVHSQKSVPSTLLTNWKVMSRRLKSRNASAAIAGPRSEPPMPMFTTFFTGLPVWPVHAPERTRSLKSAILRNTPCTCGTTFSPSTSMTAPSGARRRDVQDGAAFGHVDLLAAEHRVDPVAQTGTVRELEEESHRLVGDAVLGVVEVHALSLDREALAAFRVSGEQVAEVDVFDFVRGAQPVRATPTFR